MTVQGDRNVFWKLSISNGARVQRQRYIPWSWHSRWSNPRIRGEPWAVRPLPAFLFVLLTVLSETKGSEMDTGANIHWQLRGNRAIDAGSHTSSGNSRRAYLPVMVLWLTDRLLYEKAQSSLYPPVESTAVSFQVLRSIINDSSSKKRKKNKTVHTWIKWWWWRPMSPLLDCKNRIL